MTSDDQNQAPEPAPEKPKTGFHAFDGLHVLVQLSEPYMRVNPKTSELETSPVIGGMLLIQPGLKPGSYVFLLRSEEPDGAMSFISIYPEDVRHITMRLEPRAPRIVTP